MREDINSPRNVYVYEPISEDDPEERTIVDIMPHIGSFIFRGFVRRVGNIFKFIQILFDLAFLYLLL